MQDKIMVGSRVTWLSDPDYWGTVTQVCDGHFHVKWDSSPETYKVMRDQIRFRHNMQVRR